MLRILIFLVSFHCYSQKTDKMENFHIAPEVFFLFDNNIENIDDIESSDFVPKENDYVKGIGINVGYNASNYVSLGFFLGREEVVNLKRYYNTWAFSSNFVLNSDQNSWAASFKLGSHYGSQIEENGYFGRLGLGFKFNIFDVFVAQPEFVYSYQVFQFFEKEQFGVNQDFIINSIGLSIKFYL